MRSIIGLLVSATAVSAAVFCPTGWKAFEVTKFCYLHVQGPNVTQPEAEAACVQKGGHLTGINSKEENKFIIEYAQLGQSPNFGDQPWIGLHKKAGGWAWIDESTGSGHRWAPGEPNNQRNKEGCVKLMIDPVMDKGRKTLFKGKRGVLNDTPCNKLTTRYICRKTASLNPEAGAPPVALPCGGPVAPQTPPLLIPEDASFPGKNKPAGKPAAPNPKTPKPMKLKPTTPKRAPATKKATTAKPITTTKKATTAKPIPATTRKAQVPAQNDAAPALPVVAAKPAEPQCDVNSKKTASGCECNKGFVDILDTSIPDKALFKKRGLKCIAGDPCHFVNEPLSIIFVIDSSGSIGKAGWADLLSFVEKAGPLLPKNSRFGFVKFSQDVSAKHWIKDGWSQADFLNGIPRKFDGSVTDTPGGLTAAADLLKGDKNKKHTVILFTDGVPYQPYKYKNVIQATKDSVAQLRSSKAKLLVMGFGVQIASGRKVIESWLDNPKEDYFAYHEDTKLLTSDHMKNILTKVCQR